MTATEEKTIKDLRIEIKRLRVKNLVLRLHMDVILSHPQGSAYKKIASLYQQKPIPSQAIDN